MTTDEIKTKLDQADQLGKEAQHILKIFTNTLTAVDDIFKEMREKYYR